MMSDQPVQPRRAESSFMGQLVKTTVVCGAVSAGVYYVVSKDMSPAEYRRFKNELRKKVRPALEATCEYAGRAAWHLHLLWKQAGEFVSNALQLEDEEERPTLRQKESVTRKFPSLENSAASDSMPSMEPAANLKYADELSRTLDTKTPGVNYCKFGKRPSAIERQSTESCARANGIQLIRRLKYPRVQEGGKVHPAEAR